jgi:hypothetical protein
MASKLSIYNGACLALGERKLSSLAEGRPSRRRLDSVWDDDGVRSCLSAGFWNFAMHSIELTHSPSVDPAFGFRYAFDKPSDWVRTAVISENENFTDELLNYEDQGAYWYADCDPIYVRYISDDAALGGDLSLWPANFTRYVEHYFAMRIVKATNNSNTDVETLRLEVKRLLNEAKATDAMDEATKTLPPGSWSRARNGKSSGRRDRGVRGQLIG